MTTIFKETTKTSKLPIEYSKTRSMINFPCV